MTKVTDKLAQCLMDGDYLEFEKEMDSILVQDIGNKILADKDE